jgi:protein AbiQ
MKRFVFLSEQFHNHFPLSCYPELEAKETRPFIQVCVEIEGVRFAIPLRSNINHPFAFWTDKANRCGVDFSKAVVIEKDGYIDTTVRPYIRPNEFKALKGKDYELKKGMIRYIKKYKKARTNLSIPRNERLVRFSTLQYFEEYIMDICKG